MRAMASHVIERLPLRVDLAVSQVRMAAMKMLSGSTPNLTEMDAARNLKEYFGIELDNLRAPSGIPPKLVPEKILRDQLQHALSSLSRVGNTGWKTDEGFLNSLIPLLSNVAAGDRLERKEAELLLDLTTTLNKHEPPQDRSSLHKLLH